MTSPLLGNFGYQGNIFFLVSQKGIFENEFAKPWFIAIVQTNYKSFVKKVYTATNNKKKLTFSYFLDLIEVQIYSTSLIHLIN